MKFPSSPSSLLCVVSGLSISFAADTKPPPKPCTIHSSTTGSFFDLKPIQLTHSGTKTQAAANESYHVKGYDYGTNFTLNFCGPVVEELEDVGDVSKSKWMNVSAFYKKDDQIFSIGQQNDVLTLRGRKLLVNYTDGSLCPDLDRDGHPVEKREIIGGDDGDEDDDNDSDDDDDDDKDKKKKPSQKPSKGSGSRRKNTLISFICDTSPSLNTRPGVAFLGSPDHCTYMFEVRSRYACAGATPSGEKGTLGPGGVFGMILGIGVLVYIIGGVVYQRNVMHQRGWRQLPNYALWAGLFGFLSDMFVILFSSCTQSMPSMNRMFNSKRGGYHRVGSDDRRNGRIGRGRTSDDENRLIDDLNEEWDD